ncbi:MAG: hypothetical protein MUE78_06005 [Ilumatobacteraceae bacterium]|nr:hypothetical protein [Ilumatobacteraceae bacterium]
MLRPSALVGLAALAAAVLPGCLAAEVTGRATSTDATPVVVAVVDEDGAPLTGASLRLDGRTDEVRVDAEAVVELDQPRTAVVSADGYLDEPVVLSPAESEVVVRLLRRVGADGSPRVTMPTSRWSTSRPSWATCPRARRCRGSGS